MKFKTKSKMFTLSQIYIFLIGFFFQPQVKQSHNKVWLVKNNYINPRIQTDPACLFSGLLPQCNDGRWPKVYLTLLQTSR